jgi:hypothetical protein
MKHLILLKNPVLCTILVAAAILFSAQTTVVGQADKTIIWVSDANTIAVAPAYDDEGWTFLLEAQGYTIQRENGTMKGILTAEQIATLESGDLIIFSRANSSGDYIDPAGWNSLTSPLISISCYVMRASRWLWFDASDLTDDGGAPTMHVEDPSHPIFAGVTLDADNNVEVLDPTVASGQTSTLNLTTAGSAASILATRADLGYVWIVYWPKDEFFSDTGDQIAGGNRLLFNGATREGGAFPWGVYNLNENGEKMFLNAVAWMLGESSAVEKTALVPANSALLANYPNPFNPETTVRFTVPHKGHVSVKVFNSLGQEIVTLVDADYQPGVYDVQWNGRDSYGNQVQSGVYISRLETENQVKSNKMLLIK